MINDIKDIGKRIKELRLKNNMSQNELADGLFTRNQLSLIENGKSLPSLTSLYEICKKLNISLSFLFSGETGDDSVNDNLIINKMQECFRLEKWNKCIELYYSLSHRSDVAGFIFSYSLFQSALADVCNGNYSSAKDTLELCKFKFKEHNIKNTSLIEKCDFLLSLIDGKPIKHKLSQGYEEILFFYFFTLSSIDKFETSYDSIEEMSFPSYIIKHLQIHWLINNGDYERAYKELDSLLKEDFLYPVKQEAIKDMVSACRYLNKFDEAYTYEQRQK